MTRFDRVKQILDASVGGEEIGAHGAFWRNLTLAQFRVEQVFGLELLTLGNGATSNLVLALKGLLPFGADTGVDDAAFPRMPFGFDPVSDSDIAFIETWITDGCPDDEFVPGPVGM
jgi:hypothetical protein